MGGFFGVASKTDCVFDLFFGTDYHSHLGTRRAGMAVYGKDKGFDRSIHNIENAPFRTKFDKDVTEMSGDLGIGCISDYEPQPLIVLFDCHGGSYQQRGTNPDGDFPQWAYAFSGNERWRYQRDRVGGRDHQSAG